MSVKMYSELIELHTFDERFNYLKLRGEVGKSTFGFDRHFNQMFYKSKEWKSIRDFVIFRDGGCDLALEGNEIHGKIYIHHMNPITLTDIRSVSDFLMNPEYLVLTSFNTHNAIHYGNEDSLIKTPAERFKNDTCPWRQ